MYFRKLLRKNKKRCRSYKECIYKKASIDSRVCPIKAYIDIMNNPKKLISMNFLSGLIRGFGMAIGFSILSAFFIYLLRYLVVLNLPIIGRFIARLIDIVEINLK